MRAVMNNTRSEPEYQKSGEDAGHNGPDVSWIQKLGKKDKDLEVSREVAEDSNLEPPETPRKRIAQNPYLTPGIKRKREEDSLLTPITSGRDGARSASHEPFSSRNLAHTPTPNRSHDAESILLHDDNSLSSYDISDEVMELLDDKPVDDETKSKLRGLLNRHALRVSGIVRGRDITRVALKTKDTRIAELQQKIAALEAEREMDKSVIANLKRDKPQNISARGLG